jgi:hypothetical protein
MQVHFVRTVALDEKNYVDLVSIDGKLKTFVMTKTEEPNVFGVKEELDDDQVEKVVKEWN